MKPVLRKLLFTVVLVGGFFGGLELAARKVEPGLRARTMPLPFPNHQRDVVFEQKVAAAQREAGAALPMVRTEFGGWTLPPSRTEAYGATVMRFNALGMRGPDYGAKAPGEVRILSWGDSSILGLGVMETQVFTAVAASHLSETWGRPVVQVIGGIPGYTTTQSLQLQARVEAGLAPDWVVIGNLWSDVLQSNTAPTVGEASPFATYRVATILLAPWLATRKVRFLDQTSDLSDAGHSARTPLTDYGHNLQTLAAKAKADGAKVAFLMLPAPLDLDEGALPDVIVTYRAAMRKVAADLGAPLVDGPQLAHDHHATLAWWSDQVHPSTLGHQELGVALAEALGPVGP